MIAKTHAIPLAQFPYSSTSSIVHWLTRQHGKISTILKGAMRPKSPFLGEFELFSTSELLFYPKRAHSLYTGKECAMLVRRDRFRTNWRAMQTASYLTALLDKTTPEEAPQPELFELYEELLDHCIEYGDSPNFLVWAELRFCQYHGNAPHLKDCLVCRAKTADRFCAAQGGTVCSNCTRQKKLATLPCPTDVRAIIANWTNSVHPRAVPTTALKHGQAANLHAILTAFMMYQFGLSPEIRNAAIGHSA